MILTVLGPLSQAGLLGICQLLASFTRPSVRPGIEASQLPDFCFYPAAMFQTIDSCVFLGTIVHCSIAASCSLQASRTYQNSLLRSLSWGGAWVQIKRRLGSFVAERFLHKVESLVCPFQCWSKANAKVFFSRNHPRLACQNRTFSKIKLLLRLAAFIDTLLAWGSQWKVGSKSVSTCAFGIYGYSVPHPSGKALVIWDTITHRYLMPMYYL